jgi:hypothetical protein
MKKAILILTALTSLIMVNGTQARIGWTLEQCNAKYGTAKPGQNEPFSSVRRYLYQVGDYKIAVLIYKGVVINISYDGHFRTEEIQTILVKNAPVGGWNNDCVKDTFGTCRYSANDTKTGFVAVAEPDGSMAAPVEPIFSELGIFDNIAGAAANDEVLANKNQQREKEKAKAAQNANDNL